MRRESFRIFLIVSLFLLVLVDSGAEDVFWRYTIDRYNRNTLTDPVIVPSGEDPYAFLAEYQGYEKWLIRDNGKATILADKAVDGFVPVLCLHKIGDEDEYELSSDRFRQLLRYINDKDWYLVSDRQYLEGDFSRVPSGLKPIVMGADDGPLGNLIYLTRGDLQNGKVRRIFGEPVLDRNSMVAILERFIRPENGRINFTFYMSFDAIPFRQLDGADNPGFPYENIPVIYEKVQYLDRNFILGVHSLSHIYAYEMGVDAFAKDVLDAWTLIDHYAGGVAESLNTMAFPYGIATLSPELRYAVSSLERHGRTLTGGFDLDGKFARPPGAPGDAFEVSRYNVDNIRWERLINFLNETEAVVARRSVIWETDSKRLPSSRYALGAASSDEVWVLVKDVD